MTEIRPGTVLIAPPQMPDQRFQKAVILLVQHEQDQGTLGFCVSSPTNRTLDQLEINHTRDLDMPPLSINWGGPVQPRALWMLHTPDWREADTIKITDQLSMTSTAAMFDRIQARDMPDQWLLLAGFCAWRPGQLEQELEGSEPWDPRHSWLVAQDMTPDVLLSAEPDVLWTAATTQASHEAVSSWL